MKFHGRIIDGDPSRAYKVTYETEAGDGWDKASQGTEYVGAHKTITLQPGQKTFAITIYLIGDTVPDEHRSKQFSVHLRTLSDRGVCPITPATGTINDDDSSALIGSTPG